MSKLIKNYKFGFDFKSSSKKESKDQGAPRKPSLTSAIFNLPPRQVIRAKYDYKAQFHRELSFTKGEFFYVISDNNEGQPHYEVINPAAQTRGIVPIGYFETVDRYGTAKPEGDEEFNQPKTKTGMPSPKQDSGYDDYLQAYNQSDEITVDTTAQIVPMDPTLLSPQLSSVEEIRSGIISLSILRSERRVGGDLTLVVKAQYEDDRHTILYRPLTEFWNIHKYFLKNFPEEAGYQESPRIIPFLLHRDKMVVTEPEQIEKALNIYLDELARLPQSILTSNGMSEFLMPRYGDEEGSLDEDVFVADDVFMDILSDYSVPTHTKVKVALEGGEMMAWKMSTSTNYRALVEIIEKKLGKPIREVYFKDESKRLVPLHGERDLGILLRTCTQGLSLEVK